MAALTALAPNARTNRRHSDPSKGANKSTTRSGRARSTSSSSTSGDGLDSHPHREAIALASVPENELIPQESISPDEVKNKRRSSQGWARRLSWIPGWSFAGSPPVTPPSSCPDEFGLERTGSQQDYLNSNNRMSKIRSSITTLSETVLRDTEPTHESNFPANPDFPAFDGQPMLLHVYGAIDSLTSDDMRLQTPRGFVHAHFQGKTQYQAVLEYIRPLLCDGDLLVRPFIERYARDRHTAMVVRGAIQDCVFKCMIIGVFPMKMFEDGIKFESYELETQMYDPGMAVALGQL
ncbi:hypothetical protein Slin14017_G129570 [Septoria linicola]|nr:hypothetical protein Slin14017_G129570 [Septoria linicola]